MLRNGDAAICLDPDLKEKLQVDALFRPNLHNIAQPSLDNVAETTDAEEILKNLDESRRQNLLPLEKIRKGMQSEFQCCHTEMRQSTQRRGRGRVDMYQCPNKAAAGHLRCILHIGSTVIDKKSILSLLLTAEEKRNSKKYWIMNGVIIDLHMKVEEPFQRHPMVMNPVDVQYEKDLVSFKLLVEEMEKFYRQSQENPQKKFPEEFFRMEFGVSGAHDSWEHAYHWLLFQIAEIAPNQKVPLKWDNYVEFIRYWTKTTGWFKYWNKFDEFVPQREDSWVREVRPHADFTSGSAHYNLEVGSNTPEWFNYREALEMNPQPGVIENDQPLYCIDVDHGGNNTGL